MSKVYLGLKPVQGLYLGSKPVSLNGKPDSDKEMIEAIKNSLVCWYDPGKQQCTNESMAANPVLADLSGNGHDIECFNFGWAGMSGIGGYVYDNSNVHCYSNTLKENATFNIINWVANSLVTQANTVTGVKGQILNIHIPAFDVKISGIPEGYYLYYNDERNNGNTSAWSLNTNIGSYYNGTYHFEAQDVTIEPYDAESTCSYTGFRWALKGGGVDGEEVDVKIEVLPLYPNALVSDGVDDYCYTDGLPILTDYTVIAKREYTNLSILYTRGNCFASKCTTSATIEGAFAIEIIEAVNPSSKFSNYSFGSHSFAKQAFDSNNPYVYQTTNSYNGEKISKGTIQDTEDLFIFTVRSTETSRLGSIALYSFLLFDRTLTTAEIEWVKQNMIESGVLKTNC